MLVRQDPGGSTVPPSVLRYLDMTIPKTMQATPKNAHRYKPPSANVPINRLGSTFPKPFSASGDDVLAWILGISFTVVIGRAWEDLRCEDRGSVMGVARMMRSQY